MQSPCAQTNIIKYNHLVWLQRYRKIAKAAVSEPLFFINSTNYAKKSCLSLYLCSNCMLISLWNVFSHCASF